MSDKKIVNISSATKRLADIATKGPEQTITADLLLKKWQRGEVAAEAVIGIFSQNGLWAEVLLTAVAQTLGIKKLIPDAEGWILWTGGECPVAADVLVQIRTRDGTESGAYTAAGFNWDPTGSNMDIVAFRVVKPEGDVA